MGVLTLDQPATELKHIEPPGAMFSKSAAISRNTVVYVDGHHCAAYQKVRRTDFGLNWPTVQGASGSCHRGDSSCFASLPGGLVPLKPLVHVALSSILILHSTRQQDVPKLHSRLA